MKTIFRLGLLLALAAGVNAAIDSVRECQCEPSCWCKTSWGRHFRWLIPVGHKLG